MGDIALEFALFRVLSSQSTFIPCNVGVSFYYFPSPIYIKHTIYKVVFFLLRLMVCFIY